MSAILESIAEKVPEYGKDIKLNFLNVMTEAGSPGLRLDQIMGSALSAAYATKDPMTAKRIEALVQTHLKPEQINAAKSASAIMGMTNIYYRFTHLANDAEISALPTRLRMGVIGNPGIDKGDFDAYSLAVSVVNGCGYCVEAHIRKMTEAGFSKEASQSVARIASVIHALSQVNFIQSLT